MLKCQAIKLLTPEPFFLLHRRLPCRASLDRAFVDPHGKRPSVATGSQACPRTTAAPRVRLQAFPAEFILLPKQRCRLCQRPGRSWDLCRTQGPAHPQAHVTGLQGVSNLGQLHGRREGPEGPWTPRRPGRPVARSAKGREGQVSAVRRVRRGGTAAPGEGQRDRVLRRPEEEARLCRALGRAGCFLQRPELLLQTTAPTPSRHKCLGRGRARESGTARGPCPGDR